MVQPVSEFKSKSGLKRIFSAFTYSMDGFKAAWQNEHAFRQEMLVVVIGTVTALSMKISAFEKLMLVAVLVFVLIVELINSAHRGGGRPHFARAASAVEKRQGPRQRRGGAVDRHRRWRPGAWCCSTASIEARLCAAA